MIMRPRAGGNLNLLAIIPPTMAKTNQTAIEIMSIVMANHLIFSCEAPDIKVLECVVCYDRHDFVVTVTYCGM